MTNGQEHQFKNSEIETMLIALVKMREDLELLMHANQRLLRILTRDGILKGHEAFPEIPVE